MGAYETDKHPFLAAECNLIAELVRQDRPVLGVCLGAQLLARALGARVFRGHGPEIGFGFVDLTTAGQQDPLFRSSGPSIPVFHWHGDTFDLPEGSTLLASSKDTPTRRFALEGVPMVCNFTLSRTRILGRRGVRTYRPT